MYAINAASEFHDASLRILEQARADRSRSYLTWSVCYEFLRTSTHPNILPQPLSAIRAGRYLDGLLASPGFGLLVATPRHMEVLARTLSESPTLGRTRCTTSTSPF